MDSGSWWVLVIFVVGVCVVWFWKKKCGENGDSRRTGSATLKKQVRLWLQTADQEELNILRQQLEVQRAELESRLDRLDVTLFQQGRLESWASEVNGRLSQLEVSKVSHQEKEGSPQVFTKSILCLGMRVTLMDQLWHELGIVNPQDVQDPQIHKWIQGPFCRNCLRSLVVHGDKEHEKTVRTQCRYCSLSWREASTVSLSLLRVKREVYEYLDVAYRSSRESKPL